MERCGLRSGIEYGWAGELGGAEFGMRGSNLLNESITKSAEGRSVVSMARQADARQQSGALPRHVTVVCSCQAKLDQYTE